MSHRSNRRSRIAIAIAGPLVLAGLACASSGRVDKLEQRVEALERRADSAEQRIGAVEQTAEEAQRRAEGAEDAARQAAARADDAARKAEAIFTKGVRK